MSHEWQFIREFAVLFAVVGLVVLAASMVGAAVLVTLSRGGRRACLAPAVGFAALIVVSSIGVAGAGASAGRNAVLTVLVIAASVLAIRRQRLSVRSFVEVAVVAFLAFVATAAQFIASGRFGIPGVGVNNDLAPHLTWVVHLQQFGRVPEYVSDTGYPTAPHAFSSVVLDLLPFATIEQVFVGGLMLGAQTAMALVALSVLRDVPAVARIVVAIMVPLAYLNAAYFAQGAFKEPLAAMLILTIAAALTDGPDALTMRARAGVWLICTAAILGSVGISGLAWPVGIVVFLGMTRLVRSSKRLTFSRRALAIGCASVAGLAVTVLLMGPLVGTQLEMLRSLPKEGGNVATFLPLIEVFGVWQSQDFRAAPPDVLQAGALAGAAAIAFGWSLVWWLHRRQWGVPAAAIVSFALYLFGREFQGPYWVAKLLALMSPFVMLILLRPYFSGQTIRGLRNRSSLLRLAIGITLVGLAGASTLKVYIAAPVSSMERTDELQSIRALVGEAHVLYLGQDNFISVAMRSNRVSHFFPYSAINSIEPSGSAKAVESAGIVDFDSVTPESLDRFPFVLTSSSKYQSEPPSNWKSIARTRSYELYERDGATPARTTLDNPHSFVAKIVCPGPRGIAHIRSAPVIADAHAWLLEDTGVSPTVYGDNVVLGPLQEISQDLKLSTGTWDVVLQYQSPVRLRVRVGDRLFHLPAAPDVLGNRWPVGQVKVDDGRVATKVAIGVEAPAIDRGSKGVVLGEFGAVRLEQTRTVPTSEACGKAVDWTEPRD